MQNFSFKSTFYKRKSHDVVQRDDSLKESKSIPFLPILANAIRIDTYIKNAGGLGELTKALLRLPLNKSIVFGVSSNDLKWKSVNINEESNILLLGKSESASIKALTFMVETLLKHLPENLLLQYSNPSNRNSFICFHLMKSMGFHSPRPNCENSKLAIIQSIDDLKLIYYRIRLIEDLKKTQTTTKFSELKIENRPIEHVIFIVDNCASLLNYLYVSDYSDPESKAIRAILRKILNRDKGYGISVIFHEAYILDNEVEKYARLFNFFDYRLMFDSPKRNEPFILPGKSLWRKFTSTFGFALSNRKDVGEILNAFSYTDFGDLSFSGEEYLNLPF